MSWSPVLLEDDGGSSILRLDPRGHIFTQEVEIHPHVNLHPLFNEDQRRLLPI